MVNNYLPNFTNFFGSPQPQTPAVEQTVANQKESRINSAVLNEVFPGSEITEVSELDTGEYTFISSENYDALLEMAQKAGVKDGTGISYRGGVHVLTLGRDQTQRLSDHTTKEGLKKEETKETKEFTSTSGLNSNGGNTGAVDFLKQIGSL